MIDTAAPRIKLGALCWNQYSDWPGLRDAALRADRLRYDDIWTWDHLYPVSGSHDGPILEGWVTLAAWAAITESARLGLMVGANTFRNPALVAKMVTTLDHISGGRAVLGIGAASSEAEHRAYGFAFGSSPGERLRWLEEAVSIIRGMLHGEGPSGERFYAVREVRNDPPPLQEKLPILVGGGGERRTLRIVARYADACNVGGRFRNVKRKDEILRRHCVEVGRNEAEVERTFATGVVVIRDDVREARRVFKSILMRNGFTGGYRWRSALSRVMGTRRLRSLDDRFVGTSDQIADRLRPFLGLGFRHLIVGFPSPYDDETMERMATEVRSMLEGAISVV